MRKSWLLGVGLALVVAIVAMVGCSPGNAVLGEIQELNLGSQQTGIWVSGEGKVTVVPDIATIRLGIEAEEASVATAQSKAAEAMEKVTTSLTNNGVAEKDIQVQQFSIRKATKWDRVKEEEVVTGYRVTHMVTAKIRNTDKTGTIIDAVAEAGGDLTRIDSIGFSVDDPSAYHGQAREKAMAEAKAKAKQLAGLAGVTLGKPTYLSESTYTPGPIYRQDLIEKAAAAPAVETPISPGEMEITLTVQVAYDILK
ncbi:SIMPL domain-containing protein [Chloroflexota bacterium]